MCKLQEFKNTGDPLYVSLYQIKHQNYILPRLLQRSKECRGHYSTIYHATSHWTMRSDAHLSFWHNVKKSVHLKFKIMSITCRFHVSDVVFTLYISYKHVRNQKKKKKKITRVQQQLQFCFYDVTDWSTWFFYRGKRSTLFCYRGRIEIKYFFPCLFQNNLLGVEMVFETQNNTYPPRRLFCNKDDKACVISEILIGF